MRPIFIISLLFCSSFCNSQNQFYGEGPVKWELRKPFEMPVEADKYSASDLVILNDQTELYFYSSTDEKLVRNVKYKINTQKGLEQLKHFEIPESFDYGFDSELNKQGRRARIKTPEMNELRVKIFAARKFSRQRWSGVNVKDRYQTLRTITPTGEFSDESIPVFDLGTMAVGDVLEIYYEVFFNSRYGTNIFYFNGPYPKINCEYKFIYRMDKSFNLAPFVLPVNVEESKIYTSKIDYENYFIVTSKIQLSDLAANKYPLNSFVSNKLPHVCADFNYYRSMVNYSNNQYSFTKNLKSKNFEWAIPVDTSVKNLTIAFDKAFMARKKFLSTLPQVGTDSQNVAFLKAFSDTLNNFRYITPNHLYYNESALYEINSSDHLLKRRLTGHSEWKLYMNILKENKLFYYLVNIQDKRFGEHDLKQRAHFAYEHNIIALPFNNSIVYFMTRHDGLKYHCNELPFYYEGTFAALIPMNFQHDTKNKETKRFKILKTGASNFNENMRTENALVNISLDSSHIRLTINENLSGQFSTILRHLYLNECIDSTLSPNYFKKCVDKPNALEKKIRLVSKNTERPFRYVFDCREKISFKDTGALSLKNWFSFTFSKSAIPTAPNFEYYFDFNQSDIYNFQLHFDKPVEIKNIEDFAKKISNDYFELESGIVKNSATNYNLKVTLFVKQPSIPVEKTDLLMQLIEQLEQLNALSLKFTKSRIVASVK